MKLNTILFALVAGTFLLSCSSDDGGTTPVNPNPESENTAPQIVSQTYSVFEDISDAETFAEVTAIDSDGDDLTFEIVSNSDNLFKISEDGNLGLETGASLDYETATEHNITVSVSDGDKNASAEIKITVNNVIENLFEDPESFITTWKTPADGFELVIGTDSTFDYNFTIDWGDGSDEETFVDLAENPSHVYNTEDTYTVAIKGTFPAIKMYDMDNDDLSNSQKSLLGIEQWGTIVWESFEDAFRDCSNLIEYRAEDIPDLSNVESLAGMFAGAVSFNGAIGNWNTETILKMERMFADATLFNQDIGSWDTAKVTDMGFMFFNAHAFNQDIGGWKTQNVTSMFAMFANLTENSTFNQDISEWDVSKVANFLSMFNGASAFDQKLGAWNISSAENMSAMFNDTSMSSENYSNTLIGWDSQGDIPGDITLGAVGLTYLCSANVARSNLLGRGWTIEDDGSDPTVCP